MRAACVAAVVALLVSVTANGADIQMRGIAFLGSEEITIRTVVVSRGGPVENAAINNQITASVYYTVGKKIWIYDFFPAGIKIHIVCRIWVNYSSSGTCCESKAIISECYNKFPIRSIPPFCFCKLCGPRQWEEIDAWLLPGIQIPYVNVYWLLRHERKNYVSIGWSYSGASIVSHFIQLTGQNKKRENGNPGGYDGEQRNQYSRVGRSPGRSILGCFLFFIGAALLKVSLNMADAPRNPSWFWVCTWMVGMVAALLVLQGTALVLVGEWISHLF